MKTFNYSSKWKTDPRAAYIPGAVFASFLFVMFVFSSPAWSFEVSQDLNGVSAAQKQALTSSSPSQSPSPVLADPCLPLLKSVHYDSSPSAMDRNQRSAGKAAALGLVLGVRFALSPPEKAKPANKPRLKVWQTSGASAGDRSALAVTAYRHCQKEQALKAISEFRWAR